MIQKLSKEVGELKNFVTNNNTVNNDPNSHECLSLCSDVSGDMYVDSPQGDGRNDPNENTQFTFDIETKLKEPTIPKTPDVFLKMLLEVQRLETSAWSDVRYADTQKLYNHAPGFTELETNEEVKTYDTLRHLAYSDKAYAAITFCILKQKESLQEGFRNLLGWAKSSNISYESLELKIDELFLKGDFHKVSADLLQLVCGHRAESIEMRREAIVSQAKDPLVKAALNKIPPSSTHLFQAESFTSTLEKTGGVRKAFWPSVSGGSNSQSRSNSKMNRHPSRGQGVRKIVSSRGTHSGCCPTTSHAQYQNPPSRGGYNSQHYPSREQSHNFQSFPNPHGRGTYNNRGSRPDRTQRGSRKRPYSSSPQRGNPLPKRQKQ